MMRVKDIAEEDLCRRLAGPGLDVQLGPMTARIRSRFAEFQHCFALLYAEHRVRAPSFCDFHVSIDARAGLRRFYRAQCIFNVDGRTPFHPLPRSQAVPFFEWGLNWCVATRAHQYLLFHAAVLERNGHALVLPGEPGAGKSTLTAALAFNGWRLLSDELGLVDLQDGSVYGLARPISLKNESIRVIREFIPHSVLSPPCHDTTKGTVALLAPPPDSVHRVGEAARVRWIVTPQFAPGASAELEDHSVATSFMELAHNSFNYSILGLCGFDVLSQLIDGAACHHFRYGQLDDAIRVFNGLASR